MKSKFIFLALLVSCVCALVACDDDNKQLDGSASIYITGRKSANRSAGQALTPHEICQMGELWMTISDGEHVGGREFSIVGGSIDTVHNRLIMEAGNIDRVEDNVFLNRPYVIIKDIYQKDTLAYVPFQQRHDAIGDLTELYNNNDWNGLYKLFTETFEFIPVTGAEYEALKEKGDY